MLFSALQNYPRDAFFFLALQKYPWACLDNNYLSRSGAFLTHFSRLLQNLSILIDIRMLSKINLEILKNESKISQFCFYFNQTIKLKERLITVNFQKCKSKLSSLFTIKNLKRGIFKSGKTLLKKVQAGPESDINY